MKNIFFNSKINRLGINLIQSAQHQSLTIYEESICIISNQLTH